MKLLRMVGSALLIFALVAPAGSYDVIYFGSVRFPYVLHPTALVYPYYQPFYTYNYVGNYVAYRGLYGPYPAAIDYTVWKADGRYLGPLSPVWTGDGKSIFGLSPVWTGDGKSIFGLSPVWLADGTNVLEISAVWTGDGKSVFGLSTVWTGDGKQLNRLLPWAEGVLK
jgi:hypothetical protein